MNLQGYGLTFGGTHTDTFNIICEKTIQPLTPPLIFQSQTVPDKAGAWYFRTDLGARKIQVDIAVQTDSLSDFRPNLRAMANWLDPSKGVQPLIFDNEPDKTYYALLYNDSGQPIDITQLVLLGRMSLFFICPDPFAYGTAAPSTTIASGTASKAITLSGMARVYPKITVTFAATATEYKITHNESGKFVRVIYGFSANNELVIDCSKGTVEVNGIIQMPAVDINSDFFPLVEGVNTLAMAPDNLGDTVVDYTPRYL